MLSEEQANLFATVGFISKNFFTLELYALKKCNRRFGVVDVPALYVRQIIFVDVQSVGKVGLSQVAQLAKISNPKPDVLNFR